MDAPAYRGVGIRLICPQMPTKTATGHFCLRWAVALVPRKSDRNYIIKQRHPRIVKVKMVAQPRASGPQARDRHIVLPFRFRTINAASPVAATA
jgi:hypothetical protein